MTRFVRSTPVTAAVIGLCTLAYFVTVVTSGRVIDNHRSALFAETALYPPLVALDHQWWRVLSSGFLHFGPIHLLLNMYMLWILGIAIERSIGHWRFLTLFLISVLGGSAAVVVFTANAFAAGASGGIFGLMGAYAIVALTRRVDVRGVAILIGLNIFVSVVIPGVSLAAHLGGLVAGAMAAAAMVVVPAQAGKNRSVATQRALIVTGALVVTTLVLWVCWYGAALINPVIRVGV